MRRALAAIAAATALMALPAGSAAAVDSASSVCRFSDDRLTEISGITYSQRHPGVFWLHNDSGGGPYVYAVDGSTCATLARITLRGIEARDIEAIASGRDRSGAPILWIGDIGDNLDSWPYVWLYRIREPRRLVDQTITPRTYRITYRDRPHNAETLLADPSSTRVWIVTKQLAHGRLYRLRRHLSTTELNIAQPVQREGGLVTDGSVSPDGSRYVLRDYVNATVFLGSPPGTPSAPISLPVQPQGEAITWTPDGSALLVASERDDRLLRVPIADVAASNQEPTPQPTPQTMPAPAVATSSIPSAAPASSTSAGSVALVAVGAGIFGAILVGVFAIRRSR